MEKIIKLDVKIGYTQKLLKLCIPVKKIQNWHLYTWTVELSNRDAEFLHRLQCKSPLYEKVPHAGKRGVCWWKY